MFLGHRPESSDTLGAQRAQHIGPLWIQTVLFWALHCLSRDLERRRGSVFISDVLFGTYPQR